VASGKRGPILAVVALAVLGLVSTILLYPMEWLPGETTTDRRSGIELAYIPAGTFVMGSPTSEVGRWDDELPREVTLTRPFFIGTTEVTNAQYLRFVEASGHPLPDYWDDPLFNEPDKPVVGVRWEEAAAFAEWVGMALPTEAQWEYAARAGTATVYWSGDAEADLARVGWYEGNSEDHPNRVGELPANAWGLHDVHGNAWEWVADWYGEYVPGPQVDPTGPEAGQFRVRRGGFWGYDASDARAARRYHCAYAGHHHTGIGFRVVRAAR